MSTLDRQSDRGFGEGVASLSRLLLPADRVTQALESVARLAPRTVTGCDSASVSLVSDDAAMTTAAASDGLARALDQLQVATGEGPCLDAIRTGNESPRRHVRRGSPLSRLRSSGRGNGGGQLPVAPADRRETRSGASTCTDSGRTPTLRRIRPPRVRLAEQAAVIVATAMAHDQTVRLVAELQAAMTSRAVIEQAKGILMARSRLDADQAFDILRRASQRQNVKLRDIAREIVENVQRRQGAQPG